MTVAVGVALGAGLLLIWWSTWAVPPRPAKARRGAGKVEELLLRAGVVRVSASGLLAASGIAALFVFLFVFVFTGTPAIAACFAIFGGLSPLMLVRWRARKRTASLRELWPDVVDHLRSAIRAGLSLPEALMQLGVKGPEELRSAFREFAGDYRSGGQFDQSLDRLKDRLADPVADRIVEALRLTREVGGTDLGRLLGTLAEFLRDSARTRSELEARQSWTVNAARLAVAAPWIVLALLSTRPEAVAAYNTAGGAVVLIGGLLVSAFCYWIMLRIGALPDDERVLS
ncbi:type II secretion system F family protein [Arthrobacter sp. EH-1B-1]|uniref:Type II secretion system F family protein n=1 Tax=Arthrobacter vasquezii TaxID=2977629 RepID=A0ABT6CV45_9MICC|nr:type II secretion system F family protein [Arthrobacter vasquezii]MDF9277362.1 type II secretion system F family protein [Arthrobacter vasquezii]